MRANLREFTANKSGQCSMWNWLWEDLIGIFSVSSGGWCPLIELKWTVSYWSVTAQLSILSLHSSILELLDIWCLLNAKHHRLSIFRVCWFSARFLVNYTRILELYFHESEVDTQKWSHIWLFEQIAAKLTGWKRNFLIACVISNVGML